MHSKYQPASSIKQRPNVASNDCRHDTRSKLGLLWMTAVVVLLLSAATHAAVAPAGAKQVTLTDYAEHREGEDWAPAIRKAFADARVVHVPAGRYPSSYVKLPTGTTLQGTGNTTVFIPLGSRLFDIAGEVGPEIRIAADLADFSDTLLLESGGHLAAGDDILIRGQRNSMLREGTAGVNYSVDWVLGRTRRSSCFFGEMDTVASVDGAKVVTAKKRRFPDYFKDDSREAAPPGKGFVVRAATTISKLSMGKNVVLRDFAIEGTSKCVMPVRLSHCKDCLVENITFTTSVESLDKDGEPDLSLVYAIYVWNTTVRNFKARLSPELLAVLDAKEKSFKNFSNYNLFKIISSTASGFENCEANGGSHAFNITRSASVAGGGGIPSVDCFVRNCVASNCVWAGVKVQQGCVGTQVTGNVVSASGQGIVTCARNTLIENNRVATRVPHSADYYYTHIDRGGTFGIAVIEGYACGSIVRNNTVDGFRSGIAMVDGYEDKNCFQEGNVLIENNTVTGCLRGFTLYKNPHSESLGRNNLRIRIVNNTFTRGPAETAGETSGIWLPDLTAGVEIRANTIRHFRDGIWMGGFVDFIHLDGNTFEDCTTGVTLETISSDAADRVAHVKEVGNIFTRTAPSSQGLSQGHVREF
jgi:hypothetical protein